MSVESVQVLEIDREMRSEVRRNGKRPRDAYMDAVASIPKKFKTSSEQEAVVSVFPTFNEIRGALYKHHASTHVSVPEPHNIPNQMRVTMRGNNVELGDTNYQERFLLYSGQGGQLQIFGADTELQLLHATDFIICDGTFEMSPQSSYQLYTLHGFSHSEGMPLVWGYCQTKPKLHIMNSLELLRTP